MILFILYTNFKKLRNFFLGWYGFSAFYFSKCHFFKIINKILGIDDPSKNYAKIQSVDLASFSKFQIEIEKYRSILNFNAGVSKPGQPRRTQDPLIGNPFS